MNELAVRTMDDVERAATSMAKSGYFQDSRDMAQAVVKILAGQEMGFGPFASMTGVYIIQGRPSIGANLMAAAVKRSGRYNYHVMQMNEQICQVEYFEAGKSIGVSTFTLEDARKAGTKNLDKYARNMLFARAMSNGVRWFCPDVLGGSAVYTPEELGANVNEEGEVIDIQPSEKTAPGNGQNQPAPVEHEPSHFDGWPNSTITNLASRFELAIPRMTATLKFCTLPKDTPVESLADWMIEYKEQRANDKTPQESAKIANDMMNN